MSAVGDCVPRYVRFGAVRQAWNTVVGGGARLQAPSPARPWGARTSWQPIFPVGLDGLRTMASQLSRITGD